MKANLYNKLQQLAERHEELERLLADPEVLSDQKKFRDFSKEFSDLDPIKSAFTKYESAKQTQKSAEEMLADETDTEMKALAKDEITEAAEAQSKLEAELEILLLPKDPNDNRNVFLEIRAGTGGDEAGIFTGDLFRMYQKFAASQSWRTEIMSQNIAEQGGFKEVVLKISGQNVYASLKFESGAHRVQRVPETESQGRIHTSACTVAVMPEMDTIEMEEINSSDLKIDTFRASGAGGQHVNTTDSAIRITHIPTGIVVECQDERSQHKNKARALSVLSAKIFSEKQKQQQQTVSETRKKLVGTGDRSDKIRTYNYPQGRVTDHRINLTLHKLPAVMEGDLNELVSTLIKEYQAGLLTEQNDN